MFASLKPHAARLRPLAGTLVLLPLLGLFLRAEWTVELPRQVSSQVQVRDPVAAKEKERKPRTEKLRRWAEGVHWSKGLHFKPEERVVAPVAGSPARAIFEIQADANDIYIIEAITPAGKIVELWRAEAQPKGWGLTTRRSPPVDLPAGTREVRVRAKGGDAQFAMCWLGITPVVSFHLWQVALGLWLLFILLTAASLAPPPAVKRAASALLSGWARVDTPLAVALGLLNLFHATPVTLAAGLTLLLLWLAVALLKHSPGKAAMAAVTCVALYFLVIGPVVRGVVRAKVERLQVLNLEHRLKPHGQPDINADGVRLKGEADQLKEEDFNIIFLGDSFTYGWRLEYEETFTSQLEKIAAASACKQRVRAINFGWPGASPIVALRLLREVGASYKPDLIVYNLDMTDFRDDLLYEDSLEKKGWELEPDVPTLMWQAVRYSLQEMYGDNKVADRLQAAVRRDARSPTARPGVPGERFFPLLYPLKDTKAMMERGTMKYLEQLRAYSKQTLKVPMAMVIFPRACQYSKTEAPKNWEHDCPVVGAHVKEPNRYLASVKGKLGFPVIDLLPSFEASKIFPLYLEDDPHWTPAGATLAAATAARGLMDEGLLPCTPKP